MQVIINIVIFLLTLSFLVLIHELGHFWVATKLGITVEKFSIGFGKPFIKWRSKANVEYGIAPFLLGGYVSFNDESYLRAAAWRRVIVLLAGITANILLAILLFWIVFIIGIPSPEYIW